LPTRLPRPPLPIPLMLCAFRASALGARRLVQGHPSFHSSAVRLAAVGDKVPAVDLDYLFPPEKVNLGERLKGKKTIIVGLPGAFTPV